MGEGVGRGVLAASDILRVDGEQRLAVRRDHWLLAQVILNAAVDEEGARRRLGLRRLLGLERGLGVEVGKGAGVQVWDGPMVPLGPQGPGALLHAKHVPL